MPVLGMRTRDVIRETRYSESLGNVVASGVAVASEWRVPVASEWRTRVAKVSGERRDMGVMALHLESGSRMFVASGSQLGKSDARLGYAMWYVCVCGADAIRESRNTALST
jgi:hypothetical protein